MIAKKTAIYSHFRSMLSSRACIPLDDHCLIPTRGWVPDTCGHCFHHMRFVTTNNNDDDGDDDDGDNVSMVMMVIMFRW